MRIFKISVRGDDRRYMDWDDFLDYDYMDDAAKDMKTWLELGFWLTWGDKVQYYRKAKATKRKKK